MEKQLIEFVKENVNSEECAWAYSQMCIKRMPLNCVDYELYCRIGDLIDDFVEDNELGEEWFEENFSDIYDVFEKILD